MDNINFSIKTAAAIILSSAAVLLCAACGNAEKTAEKVQPVATVEPAVEQTPEPTPEMQPIDYYREILDKWQTGISERWDMQTLEENGLNYMAAYCYSDSSLERFGYLLHDIDGNGIQELLIGTMTGDEYQDKIILELYTVKDNAPVQIFSSGERDRYYFCSDDTIANEGSSSAFESCYNYYSYIDGELQLNGSVIFDMAANKDQPYFFVMGDERINIDSDTATAKVEEYQALYIIPEYTPFSQY